MTWVDAAVLAVVLTSGVLALARGLVREVLGAGAWIGAFAAAAWGLPYVRPLAAKLIANPAWVDPACFVAIFLIVLILLMLVVAAFARAVRGSALGGVDRTLGLLFGLARGAALVIVAYIVAAMVVPITQWPEPVLNARSLNPVYHGANWTVRQLPAGFRPQVPAPPPGRQASVDALLRATPQGRAVGRRD
jgi:membrane protein required for colicin V production